MTMGAELVKTPARWARQLGTVLLHQLYPPLCLNCDAPITEADALCPNAFGCCGRSAVIYNDVASSVVGRLKYGDRPELARFCARLMAGAGAEFWGERPVLVPVPLHPSRQFQRKYNQSAELARALGGFTGLKTDPILVGRVKRTRQQVGLSADQRQRNVAGAFAAHPDAIGRTRGRRVVIVDDVITTGSTIKAMTRALHKAGIEKIDVVSFARVVIGADLPI